MLLPLWVSGQNLDRGLIYGEDLFQVNQASNTNLIPVPDDPTRGQVVRFEPQNPPYTFWAKRKRALSISLWFKPERLDEHPGVLVGGRNHFYLRYLPNRRLQFVQFRNGSVKSAHYVADGVWQHVGVTINPDGNVHLYYNGQLTESGQIDSCWWEKRQQMMVGADHMGVAADGYLDDLQVWDRVLSHEEMEQAFETTQKIPPLDLGLLAYLPLEHSAEPVGPFPAKLIEQKHPTFEASGVRSGLRLDIQDEEILGYEGLEIGRQMTLSCWMRPASDSLRMALLGNRAWNLRYLAQARRLQFSLSLARNIRSSYYPIPPNEWVHVAIVAHYHHMLEFYVNGERIDQIPLASIPGASEELWIGKNFYGDPFQGWISEVAVWNRALDHAEIRSVYLGKLAPAVEKAIQSTPNLWSWVWILPFVLGLLVISAWWISRRSSFTDSLPPTVPLQDSATRNAIRFLGNFQAWNAQGEDISEKFPPNLIRLLFIIRMYPIWMGRHATSADLSEILWPMDKPAQQKNNRGTHIHRLRGLLQGFEGVSLEFQKRSWHLVETQPLSIDVLHTFAELETNHKIPGTQLLLDKRLWIEGMTPIREAYRSQLEQLLRTACESQSSVQNWEEVSHLAAKWQEWDPLAEVAMQFEFQALQHLGARVKAQRVYDRFAQRYENVLGEPYPTNVSEILAQMD
ncbi:LamG-like jellyroll fold domain-containing protein [Pontibacter sp. G13]|uniref:LamG-like jellyroll fold domain-containing protein n=1 Tax=Pontibacter sp. G13 TaxID=3074898 RepID=UPI00288B183F|nr:LamG-like jellyroll fold domain-containing protein [Pontibacter sp. G13]WNJ20281.1 LamG-like jellyroll fold domain-containing protein [Pontibacter sp. G13]